MAEWARVAATTITKYLRQEEPAILRNRKLTAMLQKKGRISYNHSGKDFQWEVAYKRADLVPYADMDAVNFARLNRWKNATLDYRGYSMSDAYSKKEELMNRGKEALIKLTSGIAERLREDMMEHFSEELYVDGNATGNESRIHGLESFFGNSGADSGNLLMTSSDTYAGLSTVLGNYGGTWSSSPAWPYGRGDTEYDFWTPLIIEYEGSGWAAATDNWANNCLECLRYAIHATRRNASKQGQLDLVLLDSEMYIDWLDQLDEKERIQVERDKSSSLLVELGFSDTVKYDGVEITSEYGLPQSSSSTDTRVGYGLNIDAMELMSMQGQMFVNEMDKDITRKTNRISLDFFGNLKCKSPRHFFKLMAS